MKRLVITLSLLLVISSLAFAGFERTIQNKFDVLTPAEGSLEVGISESWLTGDYGSIADRDLWITDIYAKFGILPAWEVGFDVPLVSSKVASIPVATRDSGLGDVNVWTKYRFLSEDENKFGLAGGINYKLDNAAGTLGTGDNEWMPFVIGTFKAADQVTLGAKLGYNFVDDPNDDEFVYGIWADFKLNDKAAVIGELYGNTNRVSGADDPLEFDAGLKYAVSENAALIVAAGFGLSDGSPDWMAAVGVKGVFGGK